jgi:hypothetical protein
MHIAILLAVSLMVLPAVSAVGYGTSKITLSNGSVSIQQGNSTSVQFTVSLYSGNIWGTTFTAVNPTQLKSYGINVSISNPMGDPPYSGSISVSASTSAQPGTYQAIFAATGDDPSIANATLNITINKIQPAVTTTVAAVNTSSSSTSTPGNTMQSTATSTVVATPKTTTTQQSKSSSQQSGSVPYSSGNSGSPALLYAAVIIILLIAAYLVYIMKTGSTRAIIVGVALILIGVVVWLYGDYNGGIMSYIWGGVAAILLGTIIWILGDNAAGAFSKPKK